MLRYPFFLVAVSAVPAVAQVVSYEATSGFPERDGWIHNPQGFPCDRWIDDGWLVQYCEMAPPPSEEAEADSYRRSIAEFTGSPTFFVEWMVETDGSQEGIPAVAPAVLSAFGQLGILYHTTISEDLVRFLRDSQLPYVWVPVEPKTPHTYRLELYGADIYIWFVDGELQDTGVPEGAYPTSDSQIIFRGQAYVEPVTTRWSYVRYGVIPDDFDFNGDGAVDVEDYYFMQECLSDPQGAGSWVGCAWADSDDSGVVECADWEAFLAAWTDPDDPPMVVECMCGLADVNDSNTVDAVDLAEVLGDWGPNPGAPTDFNFNGTVNAYDLALLLGAWGPCD